MEKIGHPQSLALRDPNPTKATFHRFEKGLQARVGQCGYPTALACAAAAILPTTLTLVKVTPFHGTLHHPSVLLLTPAFTFLSELFVDVDWLIAKATPRLFPGTPPAEPPGRYRACLLSLLGSVGARSNRIIDHGPLDSRIPFDGRACPYGIRATRAPAAGASLSLAPLDVSPFGGPRFRKHPPGDRPGGGRKPFGLARNRGILGGGVLSSLVVGGCGQARSASPASASPWHRRGVPSRPG